MLRAVVALCLAAALAEAAPKYNRIASTAPELAAAEQAWIAAATEKDFAKQVARWESAAAVFIHVVDAGAASRLVQEEAAYAAVLAWNNALAIDPWVTRPTPVHDGIPTPQALDARDQAVIHALEVYLTFSPPPDEAAAAKYVRANVLRRRDHLARAIAGYLDILEHHRDHEAAEYAASLALDGYNLLQRYDHMIALAEKLRGDPGFLATKPDLAAAVRQVLARSARNEADGFEREATRTGDRSGYDRCGERHLAALADPGADADEAVELRYNAAVCFQAAGSIARAVALQHELMKLHPRSRLVGRALGRIARMESAVAHYQEAAEALEEYVQRYSGERDAPDAAADAVRYAVATGDLARAARVADLVLVRFARNRPRLALEATLALIEAQLAAGNRKDAAARARSVANRRALERLRDPEVALRAGRAFAAAACPLAIEDDRDPGTRDRSAATDRGPAARERSVANDRGPVVRDRSLARDRGLARDRSAATDRAPIGPIGTIGTIARERDRAAVAGELCPVRRDRALVAAARAQLTLAAQRPTAASAAIAEQATRLELELDLEAMLANRTLAAAASARSVRRYRALIQAARTAEVRIVAHARLGALYLHLGDRDQALLALRACVTGARTTLAGSEWLERCERDLAALGAPTVDVLPERLAASIATPPIVVEQPGYGTAQVPK